MAKADIWMTMKTKYAVRRNLLPLHAAAYAGVRPALDLFLTTYKMPVDTHTPDTQLTVLHCLALSGCVETKLLPVVTWLVEEKGADVTCLSVEGYTAARMAFGTGKDRMHAYLKAQQARQQQDSKAKKKEVEDASEAAAAAALSREDQAVIADLLEQWNLEQQQGADPEELDKTEAEAAALRKKRQGGRKKA